MLELNRVYCGDCAEVMQQIDDNSIDLTVTSPPYDNLRDYNGYVFDFPAIAEQLYRVAKQGGAVVWIVGDATINGSESGTSFRQALKFMDIGFKLHDTMIWEKPGAANPPQNNKYNQVFEYMFVFSKDCPDTFNPLVDRKNIWRKRFGKGTVREKNGKMSHSKQDRIEYPEFGMRNNVWRINTAAQENICQSNEHPAMFSEKLAKDHILSWSNPGDTILDPMCGSGTTLKMATLNDRNFIGVEISEDYCAIAERRIKEAQAQYKLDLAV